MHKSATISVIIAVAAILAAELPTHAESQNWAWCDGNADSVDLTIRGCTAVIRSGNDSRQNLAIAFANRGMAYSQTKEFDRALADCDQAIRLTRKRAAGYMCSGVVYQDKGNIDHAIAAYAKAIRVEPTDPEAYLNRANLYARKKNYDRAIADYTKATRIAPTFAQAFANRGLTYSSMHDYDRAIADMTEAIRLRPKDPELYDDRAEIYESEKNYNRAVADYTVVVRMLPDEAAPIHNRGYDYYKNKDYNSAIADYNKAIHLLGPKNSRAYDADLGAGFMTDRGVAYAELRDYDKAIANFSDALKLNPKLALALYGRGLAKQKKGDAAGGEADITAAKAMRTNVAEVYARIFSGSASSSATPPVCYKSTATLPTLQQQRAWLRDNKRYGPEAAAGYYAVAKRFGDNFIQYQVHYQAEPSGSLSSDIANYNGIKDKGTGEGKSACHAPYVYLVGLKPVSIKGDAIYVSESRGLYSVVSLGSLEKSKRPFQLKLAGSDKMLCKDFRRDMGFGVEDEPCIDLSGKIGAPTGKR